MQSHNRMPSIRRNAWATHQELIELHSLLFDDPSDFTSRSRGVSRLGIYLSSPSAPLFFPLLHSLLTASLLSYPPPSSIEHLSTRLTYSMAIVRFINGMIDPLQTGPYAKPIALLSRQLGIPSELVQMRHQATHEDLPSLSILRDGLWKCIGYLRDAVMTPLVYPSSSSSTNGYIDENAQQSQAKQDLHNQLSLLFSNYKKLMKIYFRERTSRASTSNNSAWEGARELRGVLRDIETCLQDSSILEDEVKREIVVDILMAPGFLISSAGKKRWGVFGNEEEGEGRGVPELPLSSLRIWSPILRLLSSHLDTEDEEEDEEGSEMNAGQLETSTLASALALRCVEILRMKEEDIYAERKVNPEADTDMDADFLEVPLEQASEVVDPNSNTNTHSHYHPTRMMIASWLVYLWTNSTTEETEKLQSGKRKIGGAGVVTGAGPGKDGGGEGGGDWLSMIEKKGLMREIGKGMVVEMIPRTQEYYG